MNNQPMLTKTKVKTGTKVALVLIGAAAIAAAVLVDYRKVSTKVIDVLHIKKSPSRIGAPSALPTTTSTKK